MQLGLLERHDIWRCEMWVRAECIGTISTNATEGVNPDHVIFVGILNACASVAALEEGAHAHQHIIQSGWESDVFVGRCQMWEHAGCLGSFQQDALLQCGLLECNP
jgi:hypothetical protein